MFARRRNGRSEWAFRPLVDLSRATRQLQAVAGSIYAATATGGAPSGSIFARSRDVYFGVGGGKRGRLAAGEYVFQITDLQATVLLSTDPLSERRFALVGDGTLLCATRHPLSDTPTGTVVQAWPFRPCPRPSYIYLVWVTRWDAYDADDRDATFGFSAADSLTATFRVQAPETPPDDGRGLPIAIKDMPIFFFNPGRAE